MISRFILIVLACMTASLVISQTEEIPYYEIPDYPETYTAGSVAARMVDGLGFRYYWATEGLRQEDLAFRPNDDARATSETIDHIYELSKIILNACLQQPNSGGDKAVMTFEEIRLNTLQNFKKASEILLRSDDLSKFNIVFQRNENITEYPFWNNINGPIADALWHCGQVVLLRRSSGNPFNSNVSVLRGKVRN